MKTLVAVTQEAAPSATWVCSAKAAEKKLAADSASTMLLVFL